MAPFIPPVIPAPIADRTDLHLALENFKEIYGAFLLNLDDAYLDAKDFSLNIREHTYNLILNSHKSAILAKKSIDEIELILAAETWGYPADEAKLEELQDIAEEHIDQWNSSWSQFIEIESDSE